MLLALHDRLSGKCHQRCLSRPDDTTIDMLGIVISFFVYPTAFDSHNTFDGLLRLKLVIVHRSKQNCKCFLTCPWSKLKNYGSLPATCLVNESCDDLSGRFLTCYYRVNSNIRFSQQKKLTGIGSRGALSKSLDIRV